MKISGATGPCSFLINGVYDPVDDELHNDRPVFQKRGDGDKWLRFTSRRRWVVSNTSRKENDSHGCWAYCVEKDVMDPSFARRWKVLQTDNFEEQPSVAVSCDLEFTVPSGEPAKVDPVWNDAVIVRPSLDETRDQDAEASPFQGIKTDRTALRKVISLWT